MIDLDELGAALQSLLDQYTPPVNLHVRACLLKNNNNSNNKGSLIGFIIISRDMLQSFVLSIVIFFFIPRRGIHGVRLFHMHLLEDARGTAQTVFECLLPPVLVLKNSNSLMSFRSSAPFKRFAGNFVIFYVRNSNLCNAHIIEINVVSPTATIPGPSFFASCYSFVKTITSLSKTPLGVCSRFYQIYFEKRPKMYKHPGNSYRSKVCGNKPSDSILLS